MPDSKKTQAKLDHDIAKIWLEKRFEQALTDAAVRYPTIVDSGRKDPIAAFAHYVARVLPVVLLETDQPYAELLLVEILAEQGKFGDAVVIPDLLTGAYANSSDRHDSRTPLVLSFHESMSLDSELELAHMIETSDNAVFIGCSRLSQLPAVFHRLIDMRLKLPRSSAAHFAKVFAVLFDEPLPEPRKDEDPRWRDFVIATDLQPALQLNYTGEQAVGFIRDRVNGHLTNVDVADAPSLHELHGLGAARDIALDLVKDIGLALKGKIDWDEVDRGMLLVGPPGTGKTTLARSIAKDCGVKFVAAGAAKWQAVENLGQHLAKIRASFDEARRYQPSILFIDELDSIGNRETFSGHAHTYQTTVVNYLLEEIDGFAGRSQIVVIAATNHEQMIDPALRRAGRLDQVVRVSYPTMPALKGIYEYHLRQHRESGDLADDIDLDALASMSFGLTGADVEFFVRGAARRARKRRDKICQEDLLAEVLRRPRSGLQTEPFSEEVVHRLAVHEAGHATARLFGRTHGEEITYVSIAPRSDGRVGYIAAGDTSSAVMIRDDYLDRIRILLAGHAAEEVVFGTDGVSDLSGSYGPVSDLAQATNLARHLLGQTGLGGEGDLLWWDAVSVDSDVSLDSEIEHMLNECYAASVALLRKHRKVLDKIAAELRAKQELDGPTLRALI